MGNGVENTTPKTSEKRRPPVYSFPQAMFSEAQGRALHMLDSRAEDRVNDRNN